MRLKNRLRLFTTVRILRFFLFIFFIAGIVYARLDRVILGFNGQTLMMASIGLLVISEKFYKQLYRESRKDIRLHRRIYKA